MKNKIQTYVQLYAGNVELNIAVTDDLKFTVGNLKNFGHIAVSSGEVDKEECGKKLEERGFNVEETYKDIKQLLKRAFKINILTV